MIINDAARLTAMRLLFWKAENDAIYIDSVWMARRRKMSEGQGPHLCDREGPRRVTRFLISAVGGVTHCRLQSRDERRLKGRSLKW